MSDPELGVAEMVPEAEQIEVVGWDAFKAENSELVSSEIQKLLDAHEENLKWLKDIHGYRNGGVEIAPAIIKQIGQDDMSFSALIDDVGKAGGFEGGNGRDFFVGAKDGFRFFIFSDGEKYHFEYNEAPNKEAAEI